MFYFLKMLFNFQNVYTFFKQSWSFIFINFGKLWHILQYE